MKAYNKANIPLAKALRKDMTPWERKLWYDFLRNYPVRFQRQKAIGNYIADFYCAKAGLVLELDGGGHYTAEQTDKDAVRTEALESMKLTVLRISNLDIDDITPLYGLDNMVKLNSTMNHIPAEQVEKYKELQPRCYATFLPYGDPTEYEWRYYYNDQINPRYLLLKHQMGYANGNVSGYPYGHVTEPITYESIGIDPPPYEWQEWD